MACLQESLTPENFPALAHGHRPHRAPQTARPSQALPRQTCCQKAARGDSCCCSFPCCPNPETCCRTPSYFSLIHHPRPAGFGNTVCNKIDNIPCAFFSPEGVVTAIRSAQDFDAVPPLALPSASSLAGPTGDTNNRSNVEEDEEELVSWSKDSLNDSLKDSLNDMAMRRLCSGDSPLTATTAVTARDYTMTTAAAAAVAAVDGAGAGGQPMSEWEEEFLQQLERSMEDSRGRIMESLIDCSVSLRSRGTGGSSSGGSSSGGSGTRRSRVRSSPASPGRVGCGAVSSNHRDGRSGSSSDPSSGSNKSSSGRRRSRSQDASLKSKRPASTCHVPEVPGLRSVSHGGGMTRSRKLWQWLLN